MRFLNGNKKLGKSVLVVNRPVGATCPVECRFHPEVLGPEGNKCYMIRLEGMYPNIRLAAMKNLDGDFREIHLALLEAIGADRLVRLHVGGDFLRLNGLFDGAYLKAWVDGLHTLKDDLPRILCFTHVLDRVLPLFLRSYFDKFKLFASVHSREDIDKAEGSGFERLAPAMKETHYEWDGYAGGGGAWVERFGKRFLVCPEQRGKLPNCESCRYCWGDWSHGGHVAFLEHSQPNWPAIRKRQLENRVDLTA